MIAVLIVLALIVYGTLYPWTFQSNPYASPERLLRSLPTLTRWTIVDGVLNVIIYVPVGLTMYLQLRHSAGRVIGWLLTVAFAFALSFSLEYAQFFQRTRIPNAADIVTNTTGAALGAALAGLWVRYSSRLRMRSPITLLLWGIWIAALLFPLIPSLGFYGVRMKLRGFVVLSGSAAVAACLQWFIAGTLLARRRPEWIGVTLLLVPAQLFFAGRQPTLSMLAGAVAGAAAALLPVGRRVHAALAVMLLVVWQLAPLEFGHFHPFSWIPFEDAVSSANIAVILTKVFVHAGCIALLVRAGISLRVSAICVALLLAATEVGQMWLPRRTPSSTDPLIALLVAAALAPSRGRVGE